MLKVKEILEIIIIIINRLEKTNYFLVTTNAYHIRDLDTSLDFSFAGEVVSIKELELYLADIVSRYPFLDQMIKVLHLFYKDYDKLIEIDCQHFEHIINLTIRHKEIYDSFETGTFSQR